jgi:glutathione S-transferase
MKLMYAPASPFARKVRVAAIELGLDDAVELVFTKVAPGSPNEAYARNYNPLRKIPALELEDSTVLYDSTVICEYLDARAGGGIIPGAGDDRWRVLTRHALAQGMCDAAILLRYETWLRPEELCWPTWVEEQWGKIWNGLEWFEANPETSEGPMNLAGIALGCILGYLDFRFADTAWRTRCPRLDGWFAGISRRDSFTATDPALPADA